MNGVYVIPAIPGAAHYSNTRIGWIAGGGAEWMFAPNWSVKAEALYDDLGDAVLHSSPISLASPFTIALGGISAAAGQLFIANVASSRFKYNGVIARAGVNYHFTWGAGAPVTAQ